MFSLKNHPFAVEAFFKSSVVITYAVPKKELESLIPESLTLDTFQDDWAFVAVAIVDTKDLRPKGLPAFMGNDFILIGYRVFVRYTDSRGRRLRGLYILGSQTNKKKMQVMGNLFTHYNYTTTDISFIKKKDNIIIHSDKSAIHIEILTTTENIKLPVTSPFSDWKEARRFAGPLPFTFTYNSETKEVLIIEGVRENWTPKPVEVVICNVGFLNERNFKGAILANAFIVDDIPYCWKKGKIEKWEK